MANDAFRINIYGMILISSFLFLILGRLSFAEELSGLLGAVLEQSPKIKSAHLDVAKAEFEIRQATGGRLPQVTASGAYGYQEMNPESLADTSLNTKHLQVKTTQMLFDGHETDYSEAISRLNHEKAVLSLEQIRQQLILDAATAYLGVVKAVGQLAYARQSEENIRRQTGMEEVRVQHGSGVTTDVLQIKTQLSGSMAARAAAEGAVVLASNQFARVFGFLPVAPEKLVEPGLTEETLPEKMEEAVAQALEHNLSLKIAAKTVEVLQIQKKLVQSTFYPRLELVGQADFKSDYEGVIGHKSEYLGSVNFTLPLYSGGRDLARLRAADSGFESAQQLLGEQRRLIEETVRNAWQSMETARETFNYLDTQKDIAGEFLDLARKERGLGRRSLIDVLNGETHYINATSRTVAARNDLLANRYQLLFLMGKIDLQVIDGSSS
ncbi:MAG: TolC family protein [Magnetococcales bacterium]|nr:TolC family protein [Magnetococcales bacterium]